MNDKIRILMSGSEGQLCRDILKQLNVYSDEISVFAPNRDAFDVTKDTNRVTWFNDVKPHIYIHGASYHNVDQIDYYPEKALEVNVTSLHHISKLANQYKTSIIAFSTDYVFDGNVPDSNSITGHVISSVPMNYGEKGYPEDAKPNPLNFYGLSKFMAEKVLENECEKWCNIRLSGLFGKTGSRAKNGMNFPYLVLKKLRDNEIMNVVDDQYITIGYTVDIAKAILERIILGKVHKFCSDHMHLHNEGILTWYDLAEYIALIKNKEHLIQKQSSKDQYSNIKRPGFSALRNKRHKLLPRWENAIIRFMKEIGELG